MTVSLTRTALTARLARTDQDRIAAQRLRHDCFVTAAGLPLRDGGLDRDWLDDLCVHGLIESGDRLVATFRLLVLPHGAALTGSYAAQFYDLSGLMRFPRPVAEVGRFCIASDAAADGAALRLAWALLTRCVESRGVDLLVGCSSFTGTDPVTHRAALALLGASHVGPDHLRPGPPRAAQTVPLPRGPVPDRQAALAQMPPLLRSYLGLGGWVSDHAVVDQDLQTLHVFTAVKIADIPLARARTLRALARALD